MTTNFVKPVTFIALDGYILHGTTYAVSDTIPTKGHIVVASATGVPQYFYKKFAYYMVQQGFCVTTFDYRGIGLSAPKSLKGFEMDYLDWGEQDLAGVIQALLTKNAELPLFMVGHSYGGQALGLLPNHHSIKACYMFGVGAGWSGYMPFKERLKVNLMWKVVFPGMSYFYGYIPWHKLKMGEDLPLGVYRQWKRWCQYPEYYFADAVHKDKLIANFNQVHTPIVSVTASDDDWALPASRDAFLQFYRHAPIERIMVTPKDLNTPHIGHMGYFRPLGEPLWQQVAEYFSTLASVKVCP